MAAALALAAGQVTSARAGEEGAAARSAAATVFDRTYSCGVLREYAGGGRSLEVSLTPKRTLPAGEWGAGGGVSINKDGATSPGLVSFQTGPLGQQRENGWLIVSASRCKEMRQRRLALSPKGLPGPPTRFEQYLECPVTPRVLLRIRLALDRTPEWRNNVGGGRTAAVNFSAAAFAVSTDQPKPRRVAFGDVDAQGQTRLYTAPSCT